MDLPETRRWDGQLPECLSSSHHICSLCLEAIRVGVGIEWGRVAGDVQGPVSIYVQ